MDISPLKPDFALENKLWNDGYRVVGIDEAGRGTWAGPLFVGAVWLKPQDEIALQPAVQAKKIRDSKTMTPRQQAEIYRLLLDAGITFAVGESPASEIDTLGIEAAFRGALSRAWQSIAVQGLQDYPITDNSPVVVLMDGAKYKDLPVGLGVEIFAEDKLDGACVATALASIAAKVHQVANMRGLDFIYSGYDFAKNNGYVTRAHREAVVKHGLTAIHRKSWDVSPPRGNSVA